MKRSSVIILLLMLLLGAPRATNAQQGGPIYIVQAGDTLSGIARRFGTTLDELIRTNGISDPSRIFPGSELIIPGFPDVEGTLTLQSIGLGETVTSIGRASAAPRAALLRLNRIVREDRLFAGMAFIVPVSSTDGGRPGSASRLLLAHPGDTALELAAQARSSTWAPGQKERSSLRLWVIPGSVVLIPVPDLMTSTAVFPAEIEQLDVDLSTLVQGHTLQFDLFLQPGLHPAGSLGPYALSFFQESAGHWICLQGIHALAEPGLYDFELTILDDESGQPVYRMLQPLQIVSGDYGFQVLNGVPPETIDPAVTGPEEELIGGLMQEATQERMWSGSFEFPSRYYTAEFISFFGIRRSYNNGSLMWYHTGLDLYGQDVPIYAPANGRVVFAGPLTVRGFATYIDHGWGVFSGYLHQSEIYVSEGDLVEKGQVIGKVGATGRVTGPHLHWEIWVGGVPVQPLDWVSPGYPVPVERTLQP